MSPELKIIYTRMLKYQFPIRSYRSESNHNCYMVVWAETVVYLGPHNITQSQRANRSDWEYYKHLIRDKNDRRSKTIVHVSTNTAR